MLARRASLPTSFVLLRQRRQQQQCHHSSSQRHAAAVQQQQAELADFWPSHAAELQQLERRVRQLLLQQPDLQPGPALLESLAAVEVCRSNILRPAGYFADSLQQQHQQTASAAAAAQDARALQAAAADATAPVYACMPLLVLLVATVQDAVQQLASAAAAAVPAAAGQQQSAKLRWVCLDDAGLLVTPAGAAAAAARAQLALQVAQQAAAAPAVLEACEAAVAAVHFALAAVDAAVNSTLPGGALGDSSAAVSAAVGCPPLQLLMLCRHVLASWLPPVAAQAATAAAAAARTASAAQHNTTRQLLQHTQGTLAAVSSSSVGSDAVVAPVLLLTLEQAAVIEPLLAQAGLQAGTLLGQPAHSGGSSGSRQSALVSLDAVSSASAHTTFNSSLQDWWLFPHVSSATDDSSSSSSSSSSGGGSLQLATSALLHVHPGPGGQLLLTGLLDATEDAWQALQAAHGPESQQQQQPHVLHIPPGSQLCLLRLTTDVLQLLLTHHPHHGVRQQLYLSGLLPLLHLQDQVLSCLLDLRQQLAAEQAAPGGYAQLVLSGSCLGGAPAARRLVQQLLPFVRQHAESEWDDLQHLAAKQARADGRRVGPGADGALEAWDVHYTALRLAKQQTDLDWGRDLAPYFTLPGLISRIDRLLATTCGLRLVSADSAEDDSAAQHSTARGGSLSGWGPHVMHLLLLEHQNPRQGAASVPGPPQQLLGHIWLELVAGGFPCCTLLQLPTPSTAYADSCTHMPGSVVLRVPVPAAARVYGFGQSQASGQQQQQQQADEGAPLALPGPAALQALLHELGHALSYLCPSQHLHSLMMHEDSQLSTAAAAAAAATAGSGKSSNGSSPGWLFSPAGAAVGAHGLCLLLGPPVGLDVREVTSHLCEHWVRHPASLRVLSRHERLDCALPQHTALQVPRLMGPPGGCSSIRLHASLLEALADLDMHSSSGGGEAAAAATLSAGTTMLSPPPAAAGGSSGHSLLQAAKHQRQQEQAVPPGALLLDDVEAAATAGPVGGAKAAYVAARLLASAAWTHLGFEADPLQQQAGSSTAPSGGQWMAEVLLSSGGFLPSHHTIIHLLGGSADVLQPVVVDGGEPGGSITGWCPSLCHDVFQEIELA